MKSLILAITLFVGFAGTAQAQSSSIGTIEILSPWARATAASSHTGGAFLIIVNRGSGDDRLVSVSTTAAGMAELHQTKNENGVVKMPPVGAIEVKAGQK